MNPDSQALKYLDSMVAGTAIRVARSAVVKALDAIDTLPDNLSGDVNALKMEHKSLSK